MSTYTIITIFGTLVHLTLLGLFLWLLVLTIRALLKYLRTKDVRQEKSAVSHSLGETLKAHRTQCLSLIHI